MRIMRRGDGVWIRVELPRGAYAEVCVHKRGGRVEVSMDAIYGEQPCDVQPQLDALSMAMTIARIAERTEDWLEAVSSVVGG